MKVAMLIAALLAQEPEKKPSTDVVVGFADGSQNSKVVICVKTKPNLFVCMDYQQFMQQLQGGHGKPPVEL